jgi:UDP-N-acetylglucosamine diphosphorylase/glucosamine-1-phosphate N-acetyltransferase
MTIQLFETEEDHRRLLPLTYTRSIGDLRIGILTIAEKWERLLEAEVNHTTIGYLQKKYPIKENPQLLIRAGLIPDQDLLVEIKSLKKGTGLYDEGGNLLVASCSTDTQSPEDSYKVVSYTNHSRVMYPWDLFRLNGQEIRRDYELLTHGRKSFPIGDPATIVYGEEIFVEEGVKIKAAVLNSESGPIYIGKNSEIQEGVVIRGSFALGEGSVVNMGAKMRGDITVGPHSKIGGEVTNSILLGNSNKGHDGYLGNSVIGEWCNLGANTNNSNLKNNYANVKMWDFGSDHFLDTGLQFCGLIMGDHSKCGINTMFNTGTTLGVCANIFGEGFPRTFIPSFAWGGKHGFSTYRLDKVLETASLVMRRRGKLLSDIDHQILSDIFDHTSQYRTWEKT